jgi:hypothetical protein
MSWAGIANNQCVSRNNLQDAVNNGVFTLKNTIPAGTRQITKAEANNYVNLNTAYPPYADKTFNQLVVKSNLQGCINLPYSYTLYCDYSDDASVVGLSTSSAACSETYGITVYSNSSSIGVGTELYFDSCGTQQIYAYSYDSPYPFYYKMGSSYITFENWDATGYGYVIRSITDCGGSLATILVGTNNSLDISLNLSNITVNGVSVVNIGGVDPNQPGNGASVQTSQIGTCTITMTYTCSIPGQNISLVDSAFNYQCINTSTGFNSMSFFGVVVNTSVDLLLTCSDGTCF